MKHKHCVFCGEEVPVPRPTNFSLICMSHLNTLEPDTCGNRYHATIVGSARNEVAAARGAPMNSDHAPTAEEQLPPEVAALLENSRLDSYMIAGSEVRMVIMHLTAALRSNREKDAQLELERSVWCDKPEDRMYHAADSTWWKRVEGNCVRADAPPLLVEKDAKIAELENQTRRLRSIVDGK